MIVDLKHIGKQAYYITSKNTIESFVFRDVNIKHDSGGAGESIIYIKYLGNCNFFHSEKELFETKEEAKEALIEKIKNM